MMILNDTSILRRLKRIHKYSLKLFVILYLTKESIGIEKTYALVRIVSNVQCKCVQGRLGYRYVEGPVESNIGISTTRDDSLQHLGHRCCATSSLRQHQPC
jgi:hypothetical protein